MRRYGGKKSNPLDTSHIKTALVHTNQAVVEVLFYDGE